MIGDFFVGTYLGVGIHGGLFFKVFNANIFFDFIENFIQM